LYLPNDFGQLAKHYILKIQPCVGLFEALVVWLLDQHQQTFEVSDVWISTVSICNKNIKIYI